MKTTKALFFELVYDFQSERWNEFELPKLSLRELLALAKLLSVTTMTLVPSGTTCRRQSTRC
jgi:hypothetical protein